MIDITWYDSAHTIIWMTFPAKWDLDDYHQMVDRGAELIKAEQHIVHVVYDFGNNKGIPTDIMTAARYAEKRVPDNQGLVIFYKPNLIVKGCLRFFHSLNLKVVHHLYTASSVEELMQLIETHKHKFSYFV